MSDTKKSASKEYTPEVTFGKAYDAQILKRLWPFVKPHRLLFLISLLSYPIASGINIIAPYIGKIAVDEHFIPRKEEGFYTLVLLLIGVLVLEFFVRFAQAYLTQILGQRVTRDLRLKLFRRLQNVDVSYIESNPLGRLLTRTTNDVESLSEMFSTGAISIIGDIFTLSGIVIMMFALDVKLTLYAFSVLPVILIVVMYFRVHARSAFRDVRSRLSTLNAFLNESIMGVNLIQAFSQEKQFREDFGEINKGYRNANFRAIRFDALTYAIVEGVSTFAVALTLMLGVTLFYDNEIDVGIFVAFVEYLRRFFQPITELSTKYTVMQSAMASAERCIDLLDQSPTILDGQSSHIANKAEEGKRQDLEFQDLEFSYRPEEPIIKKLNLRISAGEKVAIVGPTGSGKSTLVKLISRLYDPTGGNINFGGKNIKDFELDQLRKQMAVVLQDPYLFDTDVKSNITLGDTDIRDERVELALERTQARAVVDRQADGLQASVGERGSKLSAGERQLIAFARAMARDPNVLILDEATSAVDPQTENLIQTGLEALVKDRTAIIIAHRLSTIKMVDRIIVLSKGQITEQGTHDELLEQDGLYRSLYELQFVKHEEKG